MKKSILLSATIAALGLSTLAPSAVLAANAKHPYRHVNHVNDAGNRTGDAETARLNQQQLDQARAGR